MYISLLPTNAIIRYVLVFALCLCTSAGALAQENTEEMSQNAYLLVAHPDLNDPRYSQSVILVMAHMGKNAVGVILNKPMPVFLDTYFPEEPLATNHLEPVFYGGPLSENAYTYLLHSESKPTPTLPVIKDFWLGVDSNLLYKALGNQVEWQKMRIFKGYSGWAPGQLESEINHGLWYILPAQADQLLSDSPELMWQTLIDQINKDWI